MHERKNLYVPSKMDYVRGERPPVHCIFCAIRNENENVINLSVYQTEKFIVSANLYPYNPGHILIFPKEHVEQYRNLSAEDAAELHRLHVLCLDVLQDTYTPQGFNMGCNEGRVAGASIEHLHFHVVPRYANEIGFLDIINDDRIIVEDPRESVRKLRSAFNNRDK